LQSTICRYYLQQGYLQYVYLCFWCLAFSNTLTYIRICTSKQASICFIRIAKLCFYYEKLFTSYKSINKQIFQGLGIFGKFSIFTYVALTCMHGYYTISLTEAIICLQDCYTMVWVCIRKTLMQNKTIAFKKTKKFFGITYKYLCRENKSLKCFWPAARDTCY